MADPMVWVIVVNWNGDPYLSDCLASLMDQDYPNYSVVLADNGSTDGSYERAHREFPGIDSVQFESNLGFGATVNLAIISHRADYFALLNPDAVAEPGWLSALVAEAERLPRVGMVAATVLAGEGGAFDSAGLAVSRDGFVVHRSPDDESPLLGPAGAAALYRSDLIEQVGRFRTDYFLYYEDAEIAFCAGMLGWTARYAANARVQHAHSALTGRDPARKRRLLHRNRLIFLLRCWPAGLLIRNLPFLVMGEAGSLLGRLLRLRFGEFFLAAGDLIRVLANSARYRRETPRNTGRRDSAELVSKKLVIGDIAMRRRWLG